MMDAHRGVGRRVHPRRGVLLHVLGEERARHDDVHQLLFDPLHDVQAQHRAALDRVGHPHREAERASPAAPRVVQHRARVADQVRDQAGMRAFLPVAEQARAAHEVVLPAVDVVALDGLGGDREPYAAHRLVREVLEPLQGGGQSVRPSRRPLGADHVLGVPLVPLAADQSIDLAGRDIDVVPVVHPELQPEVDALAPRFVEHELHGVVAPGPQGAQVLGAAPDLRAAELRARLQPVDDELHPVDLGRVRGGVPGPVADRADERVDLGPGKPADDDVTKPLRRDRRVDHVGADAAVVDPRDAIVALETARALVDCHVLQRMRPVLRLSRYGAGRPATSPTSGAGRSACGGPDPSRRPTA